MRVAYMMSRFPKLTETFVLYEMLAVEAAGIDVEIYPLQRERAEVVQAEAEPLVERAHFTSFMSAAILVANLLALVRQPLTYARVLGTLIRDNVGSYRFLFGNLAYFPKAVYLASRMKADGVDHLHAHFASFPAAAAYVIHEFSGIPYSFTAHGSDLHRDQHMLCTKVETARSVVTISAFNRQMMIDHCGDQHAAKIHVIRCGINLDRFQPDVTQAPVATLSVICIGSLHEVKGQRYLIEACALLKQRGVRVECHFVGGGDDLAMLTALAEELGVSENVVFHGNLPQKDVIARLKAANVAALNSVPSRDGRREGIPVALMEAMAFALPVVSSRLSGIPELVDDGVTGFLTEPRDSAAIADALEKLAADPELRRQFGDAGRLKIEREFELFSNARRLVALFEGKLT